MSPHLWLIVPRKRWVEVQPTWIDFADRVSHDEDWRGLRVLAWESLRSLRPGKSRGRQE
jgi:hypothetical protein